MPSKKKYNKVCRHWQRGNCRFGNKCWYKHQNNNNHNSNTNRNNRNDENNSFENSNNNEQNIGRRRAHQQVSMNNNNNHNNDIDQDDIKTTLRRSMNNRYDVLYNDNDEDIQQSINDNNRNNDLSYLDNNNGEHKQQQPRNTDDFDSEFVLEILQMGYSVSDLFPTTCYNHMESNDDNKQNIKENKKNNNECPICKEPYKIGEGKRALICMHVFHSDCIGIWVDQMNNRTCPICKINIDQYE